MKRFDVNACFGHWPYWDLPDKTPEDLVRLMDRNGIDRAACMSLRGLFVDWASGNAETIAAAKAFPDRLVPTATISPFPQDPDGNAGALRRTLDAGARAVRLYPAFHSFRLDDELVDEVCAIAAKRRVPVMIPTRPMMNWRFQALAVDAIAPVIERHPNTEFILSGPNYLVEYQALVRVMRRCSNVAYEISCLQGFGAVKALVAEAGADRVLFGTGAVLNYPACNVAKFDHAELTDAQRHAIAWENALQRLQA
ncbi:MAG: amidohydrolase [Phycisphaerae bacterium]|nr:amidohydrolase [Phycisphaerae bacterium]